MTESFSKYMLSTTHCAVLCLVAQLCPTLCNPRKSSLPGSPVHGDSPGNNSGVGCHALLLGIFPTQGLNPGLQLFILGQEESLEKEMATHSSICAWEILWTEEPGGLQFMGSQRVGHAWATKNKNRRWTKHRFSTSHLTLMSKAVYYCMKFWIPLILQGKNGGSESLSNMDKII